MQNTLETLRPSEEIAGELETLRARRAELGEELTQAQTSYEDSRKSVIARLAKTKAATDAKTALLALIEICADIEASIASLEIELDTAMKTETRAADYARLQQLKSDFDAHRAKLESRALESARTLQKFLRELHQDTEHHTKMALELGFGLSAISDVTGREQSEIGASVAHGGGFYCYAFGAGNMASFLAEHADEISPGVTDSLTDALKRFSFNENFDPGRTLFNPPQAAFPPEVFAGSLSDEERSQRPEAFAR